MRHIKEDIPLNGECKQKIFIEDILEPTIMVDKHFFDIHKDGTVPEGDKIFVFGSNLAGRHGAGAALEAYKNYGAIYGEGIGYHGNSYAIPTKDENINSMGLGSISVFVAEFVKFTQTNPSKKFFVTRVGCGLAGYKDAHIAPMFLGAINCSFPAEWAGHLSN